jgi:hypothetical protein
MLKATKKSLNIKTPFYSRGITQHKIIQPENSYYVQVLERNLCMVYEGWSSQTLKIKSLKCQRTWF